MDALSGNREYPLAFPSRLFVFLTEDHLKSQLQRNNMELVIVVVCVVILIGIGAFIRETEAPSEQTGPDKAYPTTSQGPLKEMGASRYRPAPIERLNVVITEN
jgi:hypothetical protein